MDLLLSLALGCVIGYFFGWLLHRERVERSLHEEVVRQRDRATGTLAETSARLELANKDMVRLRGQLTDAQHLLDQHDATIADLEQQVADDRTTTDEVVVTPSATVEAVADEATTPDAVRGEDAQPEPSDITEEVSLATVDPAALPAQAAAPQLAMELESGAPALEAGAADAASEPEAGDAAAHADDAEARVAGAEGDAAAAVADVTAAVGDDEPAEPDVEVVGGEPAEPDVEVVGGEPVEPDVEVVGGEPADGEAEVVVHGADAPQPVDDGAGAVDESPTEPDQLQEISGVGPAIERQLADEGITTFGQLAALDDGAVDELAQRRPQLAARLRRGGWVAQARRLLAEAGRDRG